MNFDNQISTFFGIRMHFRYGLHITFPRGNYVFHLKVTAPDRKMVSFDGDIPCRPEIPVSFKTPQTYFVPWHVEIQLNGKNICVYDLNLGGKPVCVDMFTAGMGDAVAWMAVAERFGYVQNCDLTVRMKKERIPLFEAAHPEMSFIPVEDEETSSEKFLAVYPVGVFGNTDHEPTDFQRDNILVHVANILGVACDPAVPPKLSPVPESEEVKRGRYVCIAARATKKMKEWTCPGGWEKTVAFLKKQGYRVLCIDGDDKNLPAGAEDFTGMRPLPERVQLLKGCDFFIGLTSGLSWLAWAAGKPVVLISGYTEPFTEFPTPYRIINTSVCHGCFHKEDMRFDDFDRCPRNKNFECTAQISAEQVTDCIGRLLKDLSEKKEKEGKEGKKEEK